MFAVGTFDPRYCTMCRCTAHFHFKEAHLILVLSFLMVCSSVHPYYVPNTPITLQFLRKDTFTLETFMTEHITIVAFKALTSLMSNFMTERTSGLRNLN